MGKFATEHQVGINNLDITFAPDGLTISGHLRAYPGKGGGQMVRDLIMLLTESVEELENMDPIEIEAPEEVPPLFET